jgi:tripartite-type tricarboxylate transporter receptor subunit TctC
MHLPRRAFLLLAAGAVAMPTVSRIAWAQNYPTRPITMIVPFAAGGPLDTTGRILTPRLSEILGQQVIIENVSGAGGMNGASRVAKAAPDGYQFILGNIGTHAYNQTLYKKPLYDARNDFTPVGLIGFGFFVGGSCTPPSAAGPSNRGQSDSPQAP